MRCSKPVSKTPSGEREQRANGRLSGSAPQALLERAAPMLVAELRYRKAVAGVPLYNTLRPPPGPSLGGLPPGQMEEIERKQASAEQAWQNEQAARQRWVASQEEAIRDLTAGQSQDNVRAIEAQFRVMKS
jgi:hypothetical protein